MVLFGFAAYNTAELDFMSFIPIMRPMYNVLTTIGRPNETIYYGRAGSVLKKEKNIVIVIYGL